MYDTGDYSISDLAKLFSISRPSVYRTLGRQAAKADRKAFIDFLDKAGDEAPIEGDK